MVSILQKPTRSRFYQTNNDDPVEFVLTEFDCILFKRLVSLQRESVVTTFYYKFRLFSLSNYWKMFSGWIILIVCCAAMSIGAIGGLLYNLYKKRFRGKGELLMSSSTVSVNDLLERPRVSSDGSQDGNRNFEKGPYLLVFQSNWTNIGPKFVIFNF
jgi:hypothetical protein